MITTLSVPPVGFRPPETTANEPMANQPVQLEAKPTRLGAAENLINRAESLANKVGQSIRAGKSVIFVGEERIPLAKAVASAVALLDKADSLLGAAYRQPKNGEEYQALNITSLQNRSMLIRDSLVPKSRLDAPPPPERPANGAPNRPRAAGVSEVEEVTQRLTKLTQNPDQVRDPGIIYNGLADGLAALQRASGKGVVRTYQQFLDNPFSTRIYATDKSGQPTEGFAELNRQLEILRNQLRGLGVAF